ncbi:MAG: cupin domain-containing protein [Candidatus Dormiibacterota bacterium]
MEPTIVNANPWWQAVEINAMTERARIIDFAELGDGDAPTFRGADYGDVPMSFILDHSRPGGGPALHRHPYDEVWILDEGEVSFTAGDDTLTAGPGSVVVVPGGMAHRFRNTGTTPVRMVCIHPRPRMETEWLA